MEKYSLSIIDYVVIFFFLLISSMIGVIVQFTGSRIKTTRDYLLAGQNMSKIPVVFSIVVTMTSATALLSFPVETYRYGLKPIINNLGIPIGLFLASSIFFPVYFRCEVSTVNEFLEIRYGKMIRFIMSTFFLLQMVIYMSSVLYGSVLAFSAVTDVSLEVSIVSLGCICTLYCSLGGLKAVLWTDVFQAILMILYLLLIYVTGISDAGGISNIYEHAKEGKRLEIFDFEFDFTRRYGFWACLIRGIFYGCGFYGTNQLEVQRILSLKTAKQANSALRISSIPVVVVYSLCYIFGLILYSIYYQCDPILNKHDSTLTKYDQYVPHYIVKKFGSIPGLTGFCMSGIFSASLSTVSSALNSASTVTVVDFIKPLLNKYDISDRKTVWLAKVISVFYGGVSIGLSFCFLKTHSLAKLTIGMTQLAEGPVFAVFLVGVLTRKACDKCVSIASVLAYGLMAFLIFGSLFSGYNEASLPLSTQMCDLYINTTNITETSLLCLNEDCIASEPPSQLSTQYVFILFKISYLWYAVIGCCLTLLFTFIAILVTGWQRNVIPMDSKCLSPVTRLWMNIETKQNGRNVIL